METIVVGRADLAQVMPGGEGATGRLDFSRPASQPLAPLPPQFAAKAKRVIYLHMAGAPSQLELFDYKPDLLRLDGQNCPASWYQAEACSVK